MGRLAALDARSGPCGLPGPGSGGSPEGVPSPSRASTERPLQIRTALIDELDHAATDRKVELVGASADARYRVRGYLSTETEDGETKVAYVWDVFDSQKRRAKRLDGYEPRYRRLTSHLGSRQGRPWPSSRRPAWTRSPNS